MMKIDTQRFVTLLGGKKTSDVLKNTRIGAEITARVVERSGKNRALLEVAGKKFFAEFPAGAPSSGSLSLVLEGRKGDVLYFRLSAPDTARTLHEKISGYTVFTGEQIAGLNLGGVSMKNIHGIFSLNLELLAMRGGLYGLRESILGDVLKKMRHSSMKKEHIMFFSYIFTFSAGINPGYAMAIMSALGETDWHDFFRILRDAEKHSLGRECIDDVLHAMDEFVFEDEDDAADRIRLLYAALMDYAGSAGGEFRMLEIPCGSDGGEAVRIIAQKDAHVLSLRLSNLGLIDILIKDFPSLLNISIFCENEPARQALYGRIRELGKSVNDMTGKKCNINVLINAHAAENIIEIISFLKLHSEIDIKA